MATVNPSAMLAESLSSFSKAAYQAFSEVEAQSRMEVARALSDTREAKMDRDKTFKELHTCQLEAQSLKQEAVTSKAALSQAELTIAHQTETLTAQLETIAQLRREVTQWKDQSRNWQEHFLRVEQERCAQSSRLDELVVERFQHPSSRVSSTALYTPKSTKYTTGNNSAPSSTTKPSSIPSPTQPPAYHSAAPPSPSQPQSIIDAPPEQSNTNTQKRIKAPSKPRKTSQREREGPSLHENGELEQTNIAASKRPLKSNTKSYKADPQPSAAIRSTTVIRRVQAIVRVKRESDSEDESPDNPAPRTSTAMKKKEESIDQQRYLKTPRPKIIPDDVDDSASPSDRGRQQNKNQSQGNSRFRHRARIHYGEEDDEEEEEDELMMGAEDNHDEIYGTHQTHDSRSLKKQVAAGPPPKKRKR